MLFSRVCFNNVPTHFDHTQWRNFSNASLRNSCKYLCCKAITKRTQILTCSLETKSSYFIITTHATRMQANSIPIGPQGRACLRASARAFKVATTGRVMVWFCWEREGVQIRRLYRGKKSAPNLEHFHCCLCVWVLRKRWWRQWG